MSGWRRRAVGSLAVLAWALAAGPTRATPLAAQTVAGDAATGRAVADKTGCAGCHGPDAAGTAAAPGIAGTTLSLPAFIARVRKPLGTMPPMNERAVSDQDLAHVLAFLRSGRAPTPPLGAGAAATAGSPAASAAPAGRADAGAALYRKVGCLSCHVNEAQGGANGPRLGPDPIPFPRFLAYVRNPTGDMPPYTSQVLRDQDLADIYAFLQTRARPAPVSTIPLLAQ